MAKESQLKKPVKQKSTVSLTDGLTFSHMVSLPARMEAKTKDGKPSYLNKGQMVSAYSDPKTGKLLYIANDGRYCEVNE